MRMASRGNLQSIHSHRSITAEAVVNHFSVSQIADILWKYGEERQAVKIARAIETARCKEPIVSTTQLASLVANAMGLSHAWMQSKSHPATKTFQALRIYVNDELEELRKGLIATEHVLKSGGMCMVVTFHSLEDRLTKRFFQACQQNEPLLDSTDVQIRPDPTKYKRLRRLAHERELQREKFESELIFM
jgi:16S rRNA (cytosine1402-N4)-methyltransferase